MCLIAFAIGAHARWPLLIAANRDEQFERPTLPLQRWRSPSGATLISGRDERAGEERARLREEPAERVHRVSCGCFGKVGALPAPKYRSATLLSVPPTEAGAHVTAVSPVGKWVPASAGMTGG